MAKDDIYQVTTTFVGTVAGRDVEYHVGELVDADDPAFKKFPEHFGPLEFKHRTAKAVEQATAAPGEKRKLSVRRKAPRQATPAEEKAIEATVEAEAEEPEPEPVGKPITTDSFKGRQ
jgi:hypothetical protein